MTNLLTSSGVLWIITVVLSFVLSQYLNMLFPLQGNYQVHLSYHSFYKKSYRASITNEFHLIENNGTTSEQSTKEPVIQTNNNQDLSTPAQLKDFGMFAKNRKVWQLFIIHRV